MGEEKDPQPWSDRDILMACLVAAILLLSCVVAFVAIMLAPPT